VLRTAEAARGRKRPSSDKGFFLPEPKRKAGRPKGSKNRT
jgi:hypothetical protein